MVEPARHTQERYGMRAQAVDYPMMLVLALVYPCNAKCPHCPYTQSNIRQSYRDAPYMPASLFQAIADESGPHAAYLRISGGGEPLLHPQAIELLTYAKQVGCRVGLITNGSLLDEANSRALLAAEVEMIEVSVDAGDAAAYAKARVGLDWETLVRNLTRLLQLRDALGGVSRIVVSGVAQRGVDLDAAERFWMQRVGVDHFIRRKFLTWGDNTTLDPDWSADAEPYIDAGNVPCPFLFERLNIDTRGNVMLCGFDIAGRTHMGRAPEQSIRDIWLGEGFARYRAQHLAGNGARMPLCAECPDWRYRSWGHNYWKATALAEHARLNRARDDSNAQSTGPQ
ncbi:radical SAM/SPASM domain-containing protein [Magnetofaba australis]|uniref:radical SAM/SPASM domain-containing protein n=1 Tax=Magnetofaba australis TaxID=1472297 RepID=UPI0018E97D98|nr:radical SAM protein [Magnetofaba australis]